MATGKKHETQHAAFKSYSTGHIHWLAQQAYRRSAENEKRNVAPDDAITAVVLAVASLEALLNELFDIASSYATQVPELGVWAQLWEDLERLNIGLKYMIVAQLVGKPFHKGKQPYQDFSLLVTLRNDILHYKSPLTIMKPEKGRFELEHPKVVRQLVNRKVIPKPHVGAGLLEHVKRASVALWACNTAAIVARHIVDSLPPGLVRQLMLQITSEIKPLQAE